MSWRNNNRNNNRGNNNNNNGNNQQQYKKSGAVYTRMKKGKHEGLMAVNAWRKTRFGIMSASAFPVDGKIHESQRGRQSMRYVVDIVVKETGTKNTYWCMMAMDTQTISIPELGLCISPNGSGTTASGKRVRGYFGKFGI